MSLADTVHLVQGNQGAGWGLVRSTDLALTGVMFIFFMLCPCTKTVCQRRPNIFLSLLIMCLVIAETMREFMYFNKINIQ